jgi:4a-hydroxytetrahydrobiopterin dehydratase
MQRSELLAYGYVSRRQDESALAGKEQAPLMSALPEWRTEVEGDYDKLVRVYRFKDFITALEFANRVGQLAEEVDHHPILTVQWGKVTIEWWTHEIGGLHRNDFVMAARCDLAYEEMGL